MFTGIFLRVTLVNGSIGVSAAVSAISVLSNPNPKFNHTPMANTPMLLMRSSEAYFLHNGYLTSYRLNSVVAVILVAS